MHDLILSMGNWLDVCGLLLVDLMWVTGCQRKEEITLQEGGEVILVKHYECTWIKNNNVHG